MTFFSKTESLFKMLNEGLTELKNYKDSYADRLGNIYDSKNKRKNF